MAARTTRRWDLLLVMTGAPYASDMFGTVLRLLTVMLGHGASVQVWACGYATMLTGRPLGSSKPRDLADWSVVHPSTAELLRGLMAEHPDALRWQVCGFCSEDRGAVDHIDGVRTRPFSRFRDCVESSAKTLYIGGA